MYEKSSFISKTDPHQFGVGVIMMLYYLAKLSNILTLIVMNQSCQVAGPNFGKNAHFEPITFSQNNSSFLPKFKIFVLILLVVYHSLNN